ncbi:flavin reductase family protein [Evansella tamaricis]|uniref:Flavin reductase family protein n=1 Tax=Evansella tamaricis TaxID=2069301 RepID=A0ABS6JIU2_9BACI|nr:flavin reductase family protein [Evansella tamaricis]MBU9713597.1 flavin reductase family protein [Evansella tamaricis]
MKSINPKALSKKENYVLLSSTVMPRPIAFVTSLGKDGTLNGAPFSFFNIVSAEPPLLSISVGRKAGVHKDTARNILEQGEFVVHLTDENNVAAVNETAANLPPHESEIEKVGMTQVASDVVKVPGLKESPVRFECTLEKHLTFQEGDTITDFIIGRVVKYHVNDYVFGTDGKVDSGLLRPIARLGGKEYAKQGEVFELERPK